MILIQQFVWGIGAGLGFAIGFKIIVLFAEKSEVDDE